MVYNWASAIRRILYPPTCLLCGGAGEGDEDLCPGCRQELPYNVHPCPRCAEPLPPAALPDQPCGACLRDPPPFDRCIAPLLYDHYQLQHLTLGLKFGGQLANARLLSRLLADHLMGELDGPLPERILPVPLHPRRLRERGFNQALELARPLAARLGIPLDLTTCVRLKATPPQKSLDRDARRKSLRGAFAVVGTPAFRHVALVDDVVTTGSTAAEIARVLKRAGVARVEVWAVAKTAARQGAR